MDGKSEKWSKDQIERLIDAIKEEQSLYASNLPIYHNKHLRGEALQRVFQKVVRLRPSTTKEECQKKFKNLRNQFNIENAKIKASLRSGTGTDDVYTPNLWYFPLLLFLDNYVTPRKSRNSLEHEQNPVSENSSFLSDVSESQIIANNSNCVDHELQQEASSIQCNTASTSTTIFSTHTQHNPITVIEPSPISPTLSSTSGVSCSQRQSKKRKNQEPTDDFSGAINNLAESFRQPIVLTTAEKSQFSTDPAVNGLLSFVGALLQSFQDQELKLDVMSTITQTVINAKALDLQRSQQ